MAALHSYRLVTDYCWPARSCLHFSLSLLAIHKMLWRLPSLRLRLDAWDFAENSAWANRDLLLSQIFHNLHPRVPDAEEHVITGHRHKLHTQAIYPRCPLVTLRVLGKTCPGITNSGTKKKAAVARTVNVDANVEPTFTVLDF